MSVVARQGFKYTLIGYAGFLLGTLASLFLFPYDMKFFGKLRFILPTAQMLLPIVVFGISYSNVKFFGIAQENGKQQNLLTLSLLSVVLNFVIFCGGFFAFYHFFPEKKSTALWNMKGLILPLTLVLALSQVFNKYLSNFKRIAVPNIFENLFPKIANILAFSLFFFAGTSEKFSYFAFFGVFFLGLIGYYLYTNNLEKIHPNFSISFFTENQLWKQILNYSFYGFLGNLGSYVALSIDNYMIGEHISFEENGVYSNLYSIISLISVPSMGLYSISAPIINRHFAENTLDELDDYHKKTSLSLFFLGFLLFGCIAVGFPFLAHFMPKNGAQLLEAEPLIWIIGAAMLIELATGFNGHIISLSKYYRFNILVMLVLAILTVSLNLYFIHHTHLGILGIGISYAVSLTVFNVIKIIFNKIKFGVFPITIEMVYTLILGCISIAVAILLPNSGNNFVNLIYKPLIIILFFLLGNHFMKIIPLKDYFNNNFLKSLIKF